MFWNKHRIIASVLCVTASMGVVLHASPVPSAAGSLRITAGDAFSLVNTARRRAPTISRMLQALEDSNVVLYVEVHRDVPVGVGQLTLLTAASGVRRFRIALDR